MEKILISSCLMGERVRYHGGDALFEHEILDKWNKENRLVLLCPEVSAGFAIPRPPSEIVGPGGGKGVLEGRAKVLKKDGVDYSDMFIQGAKNTLKVVQENKIKIGILKEGSPSCGTNKIYSGDFSGTKIDGMGVVAAFLKKSGVFIYSENEIDLALEKLEEIENYSV